MPGKTKHFHGWVLIHTITGWYADNGSERMRVGSSREEHTEALDARWRAAVKERLEMAKRDEACGNCRYYRELVQHQPTGEQFLIGACAFEMYQAKTAKAMDSAELAEADPSDEPCEDYRRK